MIHGKYPVGKTIVGVFGFFKILRAGKSIDGAYISSPAKLEGSKNP